ncbi:SusC/RagA family TonB-linked outer membrane protein [Robertkochia sediminum]|uniref:SusC/RagA family TonB-linked outer membrane protein n=1 Tax=Robertkochia sediminum TaxID=2785326 RepID=UPI001932D174|nr:TonB-dependent receptor [Robertkochia sediminum]MBL7474021.1 TonB-dependent receptor [Robertkochia sediminum]
MKTMQRYIAAFLLLFGLIAQAQDTVSGVVVEQATGTPLPGVNVIVKGTTRGTATDFDGNFNIEASTGEILVISYIGFITQEVTVNGQPIQVALAEDAQQLGEVVVIGYGTVTKEEATDAVDVVTTEDFNQGPIVSAQQLIQGKVAGVSITTGSGAPGEGSNVLIRGISSLSLNSNPLFVVDGVPLNDGGVGGSRNPLNLINPNDIESMSVLKDASATSIYGSRAANGVILITTKKGKAGELKLSYNGITSVYEPVNQVDVLTADEFRNVVNTFGDEEDIARLGNASTDWQDLIYQTAFGGDHTVSAQGGIFNVPFRASVGYTDQGGILKGDNMERMTGSFNLRPRLLEDDLILEFNARVSRTENRFANRGAIGSANSFDPTQAVYDRNSPYFAFTDENGVDFGYTSYLNADGTQQANLAPTNPIALLDLVKDQATVDRFVGNFKADYKLPFVNGLTATINAGYDYSSSEGFSQTAANIPTSRTGFDGSRNDYTQEAINSLFDAYLTYNKDFGNDNLEAVAGYSYQKFEFDNSSMNTERILNEDGSLNEEASINQQFIDKSRNVLLSYFGRVKYDINNKYILKASLRADASSKLNPDDRWGYFPSAAAAWNIHNEDFMSGNFFDQLKLRIGYGEVGNVNGLGDYNFLTRYVGSTNTALYQFGTQFYQTYRPEPINADLKWEVGSTWNAGLDFAILNSRVNGSVNAYIKKTNDLIANTVVDPFTNFGNTIPANIGDMENKGIEIELGVTPVETEDFRWTINYNVAFNENTITRLPDTQDVGGISGGTGNTIQRHQEGLAPFSFFVYKQIYDENGNPIEGAVADINGDGQITPDDRYFYKDPYANVIMGLSTSINYKNWDFQAVSRANVGNYVYNNVASQSAVNNVFQNEILTNTHSAILTTGFQQFTERNLISDYYIENASFFRLDNVTLGYTFQDAFFGNPFRVYGAANNLLVISNYSGLDPEITGGIDNNFYPRPRVFVLGLDLNF